MQDDYRRLRVAGKARRRARAAIARKRLIIANAILPPGCSDAMTLAQAIGRRGAGCARLDAAVT
jgi:hypothetical protein